MKKIYQYLKTHLQEDFNPGYYAFIAIFLVICFYINYSFGFKRNVLDSQSNELVKLFYYFLFFAFPYYTASIGYAVFYKTTRFLKSPAFWLLSLFLFSILTLNRASLNFSTELVEFLKVPGEIQRYTWLIIAYVLRTLTMMAPIFVYAYFTKQSHHHLYGFTTKNFNLRPYLWMLGIMLPLIIWASFQPSFLKAYPRYKPTMAEIYFGVSYILTMIGFHLAYALRFVSVEFFFRGFAIMGMPKEMGRAVVMPASVLYAFWHFGKPMGEALGSIFGSYILGIIALESGSILGGIIVHIGIALLMDWAAYLQTYYFK